MPARPTPRPRSGCLIAASYLALATVFLVLNCTLVGGVFAMIQPLLPEVLQHPKALQITVFVVPVILIVVEWRLIDALLYRLTKRRGGGKGRKGEE